MKDIFKKIGYPLCFVLGIVLSFLIAPIFSLVGTFVWGIEVRSAESFPIGHTAKIRTRPGLGDQTLFFEVDGNDVWKSGDAAPGDLNETIIWDKTGRYVTFEISGKTIFIYDVESKTGIEKH